MGGVRAEYRYDGLVLTCDTATVVRLHALLRAELAVADPVSGGAAVRYITVRDDTPPPAVRKDWLGWLSVAGGVVAMGVSTGVYIAGLVSIAGWVSR